MGAQGVGGQFPSSFGARLASSSAPSYKQWDAQQRRDPKPTSSRGPRCRDRAQIMETLFLM